MLQNQGLFPCPFFFFFLLLDNCFCFLMPNLPPRKTPGHFFKIIWCYQPVHRVQRNLSIVENWPPFLHALIVVFLPLEQTSHQWILKYGPQAAAVQFTWEFTESCMFSGCTPDLLGRTCVWDPAVCLNRPSRRSWSIHCNT